MEEKNKIEMVKDKKILVTAVELETNPNDENQINKMRFKSDIGDITWKPKSNKEDYVNGLKRITKVPMELGSLPQIINNIGKTLQENGKVFIDGVSYMVMETKDAEDDPVTYRFFTSEKFLDKWKIVEE